MLSAPLCASAFSEAWSCFCWVESRMFQQEGWGEATLLWGEQKLKCERCEVWDCSPAGTGSPRSCPSPCPHHRTEMNISVSCQQHQSHNHCLSAREPNFWKYWTKISAGMVPKQTRFQHWIYTLHLNIHKPFLWRSLYKCILKSSLSTLLRTQQSFVFPLFGLIWGLIPSLSYRCFLNSCGNSGLVQNSSSVTGGAVSSWALSLKFLLQKMFPVFPVVAGEVPGSVFSLFRFRFTSHTQAEKMWELSEPSFIWFCR